MADLTKQIDASLARFDAAVVPAKKRLNGVHHEDPPDDGRFAPVETLLEQAAPAVRQPLDWDELADKTPPVRSWRISHWLTSGPTLLAGPGGIGKSLIAQTIATALALGKRFIDDVHESSTVLYWACEDDHDELWRRQIAICKLFGATLHDLKERLVIEPRYGCENTLYTMVYGTPAWTQLRDELHEQVQDYRAQILFLDNIGQTYGARENDRHHVTAFLNGIAGMSDASFSAIIMGHPSKTAGSEFSGSTAWENAVRMRWFMGATLPDQTEPEAEEADPNIRYLAKRKTNYTLKDYRKLEYRDGVFVPEDQPSSSFSQRYGYPARLEAAQDCVLYALAKFQEAGVRTSDARTSPDYLPKKMRDAKLAADYSPKELAEAIMKLRLSGRVGEGVVGKLQNRMPKRGLVCT